MTTAPSPPHHARRFLGMTLACGLVFVLGACGMLESATPTKGGTLERSDARGGKLAALALGPVLAWDPQRINNRDDMAFAGRVFARTLTAFAPSLDPKRQATLVGDLATGTGEPSKNLKRWSFTLRSGPQWDDGSPVVCDDIKYGVARSFATDIISDGPTDALVMLDIPKNADGTSIYKGPFKEDTAKEAQAAFDAAVTCKDSTITFSLATPSADFPLVVSTPAWGPFKRAFDKGAGSKLLVHSCGPYMLKGAWDNSTGGVFVRNPKWKPESDPIRKAYPDEIRYTIGLEAHAVAQRIMADGKDGGVAVSLNPAPPALQQQIKAAERFQRRSVNPRNNLIDYLAPNMKSPTMSKPGVRLALAQATNRKAYIAALGGTTAAEATSSLLPRSMSGGEAAPVADEPDIAGAKTTLAGAGVPLPVPVKVAYRSTETSDKAIAALASSWKEAGFAPTLEPIKREYFTAISAPDLAGKIDVFWANWAPTYPSETTILPPLFDSALNLTPSGSGRDYGYVDDKNINTTMSTLATTADSRARAKGWSDLNATLLKNGYYIALAERRSMFIAGSRVRNLSANEVLGGVIEFGDIAVSS